MIGVIIAMIAQGAKDFLGTFLVVAESRNARRMAGVMASLSALAVIAVTIFGAGTVLKHGWTLHSILVMVAIAAAAFFGTQTWTMLAAKYTPDTEEDSERQTIQSHTETLNDHEMRLAALEAQRLCTTQHKEQQQHG
jgi:cytochrome c-type biogenesis protein CcmH/NrfG